MPHNGIVSISAPRRARRRVMLIALVLATLGVVSSCESKPQERNQVIHLVNLSRTSSGLKPLSENTQLDVKADKWARHLRDVCNLSHSNLSDGAPRRWMKLGENVGYGGNIDQVHTAYLNSPGHRANIMDPQFTTMGAAAVWGDCNGEHRVFTVQVFMFT